VESVVGRVVACKDFVEPEGEGICWSARVWVRGREELHDVRALSIFFRETSEDVDPPVGAAADPLDGEREPVGDGDGTRDPSVIGFVSQRWAVLFTHSLIHEERVRDVVELALEDGVSSEEVLALSIVVVGLVSHASSQSGEQGLGLGIKIG
jgi:hypothetical protein